MNRQAVRRFWGGPVRWRFRPSQLGVESGAEPPHSKTQLSMKTKWLFTTYLIGLCASFASRVSAQNYSIDWYTIASGGGTSTGGVYNLSGTIGQPDTGTMAGGNFTLIGGFWSLVAGVSTPGTPALTFTLSSTNSILVCWPSSSTNFVLQQNADLGKTNWVNVAAAAADNGSVKCVAINPSRGALFFRLKQ
jgi:hypothetical protein